MARCDSPRARPLRRGTQQGRREPALLRHPTPSRRKPCSKSRRRACRTRRFYLSDGARWTRASPSEGFATSPASPKTASRSASRPSTRKDPVAILVLGRAPPGDLYSSQDKGPLGALASQLGIALANARAFGTITSSRDAESKKSDRGLRDSWDENRFRAPGRGRTEGATLVGTRAIREITRRRRVARSDAKARPRRDGTGKGYRRTHRHAHHPLGRPLAPGRLRPIAASVFESELFRHERGAFPAQPAARGPSSSPTAHPLPDEIGCSARASSPAPAPVPRVLPPAAARSPSLSISHHRATHRGLDDMVRRASSRGPLLRRCRQSRRPATPPAPREPLRTLRIPPPARGQRCAATRSNLRRRTARMAAYVGRQRERAREVLERAIVLCEGSEITAADLELTIARRRQRS